MTSLADPVLSGRAPAGTPPEGLAALVAAVGGGGVVALTGAGISTESGIPDYRGPSGVARQASPITYQEFVASPSARRRYWARSYAGWPVIRRAQPNAGHRALAALERHGLLTGVITQNVDRLHHAAGSGVVEELHGTLDRVICLTCREVTDRAEVQRRLAEANPEVDLSLFGETDGDTAALRPDGDLALAEAMIDGFRTVGCLDCGWGPLKPDVVFFGETVPRQRVARCTRLVDGARLLLVLGSSLTVRSGYRFVRAAAGRGIPVAVVNQGPTRADADCSLRLDAPLGAVLPALLAAVRD